MYLFQQHSSQRTLSPPLVLPPPYSVSTRTPLVSTRTPLTQAKAYNKLLLQQEAEKKAELEARNARQKMLMQRMANMVNAASKSKGAEDERRANLQRQEKEEL